MSEYEYLSLQLLSQILTSLNLSLAMQQHPGQTSPGLEAAINQARETNLVLAKAVTEATLRNK